MRINKDGGEFDMVPCNNYTIQDLRQIIAPIAKDHGISQISVFGSYSRGSAKPDSDIDLIIEKGHSMSLFQLSALRLSLEDALHIPVDLITTDSSDREFLQSIAKDEVLLYRNAG